MEPRSASDMLMQTAKDMRSAADSARAKLERFDKHFRFSPNPKGSTKTSDERVIEACLERKIVLWQEVLQKIKNGTEDCILSIEARGLVCLATLPLDGSRILPSAREAEAAFRDFIDACKIALEFEYKLPNWARPFALIDIP